MSLYDQLREPICLKRRARRMCAQAFGVEEHRLVGASRVREIVVPRHATYYVLRRRFPMMSLPSIGRFMGGRDHSTILHGIRAIEARMERDPALRVLVNALVNGRLPQQQDCHVSAWLVAQHDARIEAEARAAFEQRIAEQARERRKRAALADQAEADPEFLEALDPSRVFCGQCDRAVTRNEAARCLQSRCGLKMGQRRAVAA